MMSQRWFRHFRILFGLYISFLFIAILMDRATAEVVGPVVDLAAIAGMFAAFIWASGALRASAAIVIAASMAVILSLNPSYLRVVPGYITWFLVALSFVPKGEGTFVSKDSDWEMPSDVESAAVVVLGATVSFSGLTKLMSPVWRSGDAIGLMMSQSRFQMDLLGAIGPEARSLLTWTTVALELVGPLLLIFRRTRMVGWAALFSAFVGMLFLMKIYVVIAGMLLMLGFIFPACRQKAS